MSPESPIEVNFCGDCNDRPTKWASLNRGLFLCDDCASIHRLLGRHVSQLKHSIHSEWTHSQIELVQTLSNTGGCRIWETTLLDPNRAVKVKSQPSDTLERKEQFIKAKYVNQEYLYKDDEPFEDRKELSAQLFSVARTSQLGPSLRFLAHGARTDWQNPDIDNNTALHVAVQNDQLLQVELLCIYGANPTIPNNSGLTAEDIARDMSQMTGNTAILDRLVEIRHELPDRLTFYVVRKRPNHKTGNHFVDIGAEEHYTSAKDRLVSLPDEVFTELCADLFDEVDRRELETVWAANFRFDRKSALMGKAFLPIHPEYSQSRNQGRAKIAKMDQTDFFTLLIDVINEFRKRVNYENGYHDISDITSDHIESDLEEPIYDEVASTSFHDSDVDNEIQEITSEKSDEMIELRKELEQAKKQISSLSDQNSIFRDRITTQAKELSRYRGKKLSSPLQDSISDVRRGRSRSKVEALCQGVSTSLKKLLSAVKEGQTDRYRGCADEIGRCISDLIELYDGNGSEAINMLGYNRDKLIQAIKNLPEQEGDEVNDFFTYAREIATNIKLLLQKDAS